MKKHFEKCIKCTERYPACQSHCGYGIEAKKKQEEERAMIKKNKEPDVFGYVNDREHKRQHDAKIKGWKK